MEPAATCPRAGVFYANDPDTDLMGGAGTGSDHACFRFTGDGHLIHNLRLDSSVFERGGSYTAGAWIGDQLLLPENRSSSTF